MSQSSPVFRFGSFRLDPAARELRTGNELVQLSPRMFDCLVWLFEHRNRAVGRDELSSAVWGRVDITDSQIDQLLRKVRRAVGDNGGDQEIIRTVPRFGYRWVAEVQVEAIAQDTASSPAIHDPRPAAAAPIPAPLSTPPTRLQPWWIVLGTGTLCAALFLFFWLGRSEQVGSPVPPPTVESSAPRPRESVVVLPFVIDDSGDDGLVWLRLGLMELVATRMRDGGLSVVPTSSIVALTRESDTGTLDMGAIQSATEARYILAPSVRRTSTGWRVRVELLGAEGIARELEAHADDAVPAARDIADRLLVLLGQTPPAAAGNRPDDEDLQLRRIDAAIDGGDYERARNLFDALAQNLRTLPAFRLRQADLERVLGHDQRALELFQSVVSEHTQAPLDAPTHGAALMGLSVMLIRSGNSAAARPRLDEAIELARTNHLPLIYGDAMASRATLNATEGRNVDADHDFAQARIALELASDSLGLAQLEANQAGTLIMRNRYAEASRLLDRAIERMRRFPPSETLIVALGNQIHLRLTMLEPTEALDIARRAQSVVARIDDVQKRQAFALHEVRALLANGLLAQARRQLEELDRAVDVVNAPQQRASVLGNLAQLAWLESRFEASANFSARQLEILASPALSAPLYARTRAAAFQLRIRALRRLGASGELSAELERFVEWTSSQQDTSVAAQARLIEAERRAASPHPELAIDAFDSALAAVKQSNPPIDIARVLVSYGDFLLSRGDLEAATRVVGQVARWAEQDFESALLQLQLYHALGQRQAWQAALARTRLLAGERMIPLALTVAPVTGRRESPPRSSSDVPVRISKID